MIPEAKKMKGCNMKDSDLYSSGEFAKMAHVSVRTIRYYDKQNILKPTYVTEYGSRFYSHEDLVRLQQILLLKYLGFSLDDIREITIDDSNSQMLLNSLNMQLKLVQDRIEQMQMVEKAIKNTTTALKNEHNIDWSQMLELIHLTNAENSIKTQYQNASNISARINLHKLYSHNKTGWFRWIYDNCNITSGMKLLEIGCGSGALWTENLEKIPTDIHIYLSDISQGMIRDTRRAIGLGDERFHFGTFDCCNIPHKDNTFDLVIANHLLFYCDDINKVLLEVCRVLKPGGKFICSTYGDRHMCEIDKLVKQFDGRIILSDNKLYERFGLQNGHSFLQEHFHEIEVREYEDYLEVNQAEPLIEYILSCHGNQNEYILSKYQEFRTFVENKLKQPFHITKEAGIFICTK